MKSLNEYITENTNKLHFFELSASDHDWESHPNFDVAQGKDGDYQWYCQYNEKTGEKVFLVAKYLGKNAEQFISKDDFYSLLTQEGAKDVESKTKID